MHPWELLCFLIIFAGSCIFFRKNTSADTWEEVHLRQYSGDSPLVWREFILGT